MDKKKRTQIAFDINPEIHKQVKILAAMRNISMNLWIARAIADRIAKETKHDEKLKE
jgi:predicted HicB family RNase H-like nuclease